MISLRTYSKVLKEKNITNPVKRNYFGLILSPFKALNSKDKFLRLKRLMGRLNFANKVPFGALVVFWLGVLIITIFIANKLRYEFFVDLMVKNFPEVVAVPADSAGNPLYMSVLDRMFAEFNAINNVGYLIFFGIILRTFLKTIWDTYNPRKRQIFGRI